MLGGLSFLEPVAAGEALVFGSCCLPGASCLVSEDIMSCHARPDPLACQGIEVDQIRDAKSMRAG